MWRGPLNLEREPIDCEEDTQGDHRPQRQFIRRQHKEDGDDDDPHMPLQERQAKHEDERRVWRLLSRARHSVVEF